MPVHAREKKESNHEEMEVDFPDQDASSTDEEDTVSSSVSEDGDSSDMDDEDCERRRIECMDEMTTLEKQFGDLKEQLYKERLSQVDIKLKEVIAGCAQEYLEPLANLQENMQIRTKVADDLPTSSLGIYRELCLESVKNKYDCEIQAACQHWESEKLLLFDTVQSELEEKIRRLEEDRHSIDITSELWNDGLHSRKNKKRDPFCPAKKKKPVVVSGPYIVYMLQDLDILEDWTAIRKAPQAMASLGPHRVKVDVPAKADRHHHVVRSEEGRLFYDSQWYCRGQAICINRKDQYPTSAMITTINHDEVWFKRQDGSKSKLYISQLQKGKYTIKHS
ncbi:breast cancer metastasis-suppressor 1-like protein-A isoform X1 [Oncorhynchus nerka]|uniref:BRMS1 like transcriptional repressor b n=2 Tax=Oncorhynchus TaxID=8016 RepID=A0A8C7FER1_ONCKI|nr:breast cancer metastasis-suppressor 1-like protein-A isoform X1 [Oncorhynchus kisutch]XP_021467959.1 breast cancer metastasis-suppressor 1-like protein-A isoform X1 [Oncorhynchus mykiss]XP_024276414.1 breast cancer metastasis-suppressor 1-like protein-A isoform X1 [Oncorhynchus tshawytscha]XP_029487514.1 breast cancer metastasis-suppressor 1-like protein-A isoform X1 [Oncorhynchus nerka]